LRLAGGQFSGKIQQGLVALLTLSMLLIPATCASAAGPHSIFVDPAAHQAHLQHQPHQTDTDAAMDIATMSGEELLLHLAFGHQMSETTSSVASLDDAGDPCDSAPRLRDMPSSMTMAALSMPSMIEKFAVIELPVAKSPQPSRVFLLSGIAAMPESPPPQD
jgi:hypothetical protein